MNLDFAVCNFLKPLCLSRRIAELEKQNAVLRQQADSYALPDDSFNCKGALKRVELTVKEPPGAKVSSALLTLISRKAVIDAKSHAASVDRKCRSEDQCMSSCCQTIFPNVSPRLAGESAFKTVIKMLAKKIIASSISTRQGGIGFSFLTSCKYSSGGSVGSGTIFCSLTIRSRQMCTTLEENLGHL